MCGFEFRKVKPKNIVIDPVVFAKNGFALMPLEDCDFCSSYGRMCKYIKFRGKFYSV